MPQRERIAVADGLLVGAILSLLAIGIYAQTVTFEFVRWDDHAYVADNARVTGGLTLEGLRWAWSAFHASNWHPLTWISHMLDSSLFGPGPGPPHAVNAVLHVTCAWLLFAMLRSATGRTLRSAIVAILFLVHPLRVESVAWVSERKDVLSGAFAMATLLFWTRYARSGRLRWNIAATGALALGLAAKPSLVVLPVLVLLFDVWPLGRSPASPEPPNDRGGPRRSWPRLLSETVPLFALAAASSIMTLLAQGRGGAVESLEQLPLAIRLANAANSYLVYLARSFWPDRLAFFYPHPYLTRPDAANAILLSGVASAAVLTSITVAVLVFRRRHPQLAFGWLWFAVSTLPVAGIIQVGNQAMADRYTYLSSIGLLIAVVWTVAPVIENHPRVRSAAAIGTAALVLVLAGASWVQTSTWRDSETLFRHAIAVTRNNYVAHNNLANELVRLDRTDEAIGELNAALAIRPDLPEAHNNLGLVLAGRGDLDGAERHYRAALAARPDYAKAHFNLALCLARQGREDVAEAHVVRALQLDPELPGAQALLERLRSDAEARP